MRIPKPARLALAGICAVVAASVASCVDHSAPESEFGCNTAETVSFANQINPIIQTNCVIVGDGGCHNGGNGASLDWRVFSNFQSHALNVKDRITRPANAAGHMPKIGSITDAQIRLIVCWVEQGAQNN